MLSIDTNILFHAYAQDRPEHTAALAWLQSLQTREDVMISELVLVEFYRLLRSPAVVRQPLSAAEARDVVMVYRRHPRWRLTGYSPESPSLHDELWKIMGRSGRAYRSIYDTRLALTLKQWGVNEFATCNVKDFQNLGFNRVWNPLHAS